MIVLGIDPGTAATGYGVVSGEPFGSLSLIECGVIRTHARDPLPSRLREIYDDVSMLISRHHPDALSIEDVFYAKNVRTTVVLGHARGVILLAAQQAELAIHEYPPAEIKKAVVGTGSATKSRCSSWSRASCGSRAHLSRAMRRTARPRRSRTSWEGDWRG